MSLPVPQLPSHPFNQLSIVFDELNQFFQAIDEFCDPEMERDSFKIQLVEWCSSGHDLHEKLTQFLSHEFIVQDDDEESEKSLVHLLFRVDVSRSKLGEWIDFLNGQLMKLSDDLKN